MRRVLWAGLAAIAGCLLFMPTPSTATPVTIDSIIYQQTGTVDPSVYSATADFSLSGNTLKIVLTNTSSGLSGGTAATNLLVGLAFNLPTGVTIANAGATNSVAITTGSTAIGFPAPISDSTWGAANGAISSINNIPLLLGTVNESVSTLQAQTQFDLAGAPASVSGPGFGILSNSVADSTAGGLDAVKNSLTFTLLLNGTLPSDLIAQINNGFVVASFGSPNTVPEASSLLLVGTGLAGLGLLFRSRRLLRRFTECRS